MPAPEARVALALLTVYLVWGSTYLAIAVAVEGLPPFLMAGVRFALAGGLLYGWTRVRGAPAPARAAWRGALVTGAALFLTGNGLLAWAEQRVASGVAALVVATIPLWVALLDAARPGGRAPSVRESAGLVLGFAGVALLAEPAAAARAGLDALGLAALLLASLSWAWASLRTPRAGLPSSLPQAAGMQMLAGGAGLLAASVALGEPWRVPAPVPLASLAATAYLVVLGSIVGFLAYAWLLRHAPPARVATYAFVNPLVALVVGAALAGEPLTLGAGAPAALIVAAAALVALTRARSPQAPRAPVPPVPPAARVEGAEA